jgi:hypothetical protein
MIVEFEGLEGIIGLGNPAPALSPSAALEMPDVGKPELTPDALFASTMRQGAPVGLLQQ